VNRPYVRRRGVRGPSGCGDSRRSARSTNPACRTGDLSPPTSEGTKTTGTRGPPPPARWRSRAPASRASSLRSSSERPLTPSRDHTETAPVGVGPWSPVTAVKLVPKPAGGDRRSEPNTVFACAQYRSSLRPCWLRCASGRERSGSKSPAERSTGYPFMCSKCGCGCQMSRESGPGSWLAWTGCGRSWRHASRSATSLPSPLTWSGPDASWVLENAVLRHQVNVLRRGSKRRKLHLIDRLKLLLGARLLPSWRRAIAIVQPETILRWHRAGFRMLAATISPSEDVAAATRDDRAHPRHGGARATLGR
jgi:hypothetical protein